MGGSLFINCIIILFQITGDYVKARESLETVVKESKVMGYKSSAVAAQEELWKLDSEKRGNGEDKTV